MLTVSVSVNLCVESTSVYVFHFNTALASENTEKIGPFECIYLTCMHINTIRSKANLIKRNNSVIKLSSKKYGLVQIFFKTVKN